MSFELFEYKIEDLGKIITGKTPPSKISDAFSAQGIPFVTPKDMDGRRLIDKTERYLSSLGIEAVRNCLLPQNSIAVSCIGSDMGKTVLLPGESITNQQINAIVVDSERFDYKYVYYYLSTLQDAFKAIAGGSATPILNKGHFSQFKVSLPVKLVQNKIALILDSLDTKIEVNTEINQTLEQMAQALFKSWFVDFEPVKNKIAVLEAGGSQEEATLAAMTAISGKDADALAVFEREHPEQYAQLKATAELFPAAMQDSELGAIPKGWGVASISEMGKVTCGKTPSKKEPEYYGSDVPFIKIPDMHGQLFVLKTNEYLSEAGSKSQLKKLVPANSICVSCIATIGVVSITNEPSHTNQQINSVTPHKSSLLYYLYFCMLGLKDHLHILGSAGSATLNVNTSTFSGIKIAQPDAKVLELFHAKCTHLFNEIKSLSVQTESLTQLRDTLLPKLLSGEITLPEAEQIISEEA
ncbi:restriction endonuclease subunit S [Salmonella enterica subsp. enterica]|uniref:Restriction endonuclease subunit S n=1 Tax=Salmonella enterica I TaxID=59201 RepID=A0A5Y3I0Y3_SALET|nr:restriction endonuclease subunit S [Salmonella enterica]EBV4331749.1 restriction endonuclease subunit S [Salmonella enterica subsp. enterica serovar Caracas]ECE0044690.1 restriction endonuclease subunit S [Salmonella enterica subsp. enterica]ECT8339079.1 restriction endonuclease subunit S [Salmonella enterica subsp. enterica serovar Anatum]HCM2697257.1 restriction endonuclease subunit S [Salmonella enterica subsp. enterica serovar Yaba]